MRYSIMIGALFLASSVTAASADETKRIAVVERATTDVVTDTGVQGDSPGDLLTYANEIYDEKNETRVGSNNGWCIRTVAGKAWECFWTLMLAKGQITVQGPFMDGQDSVMAVTGGTGAYSKAKGEMALHARNPEGTEYDFVYKLAN
jgi:hypothetical protein